MDVDHTRVESLVVDPPMVSRSGDYKKKRGFDVDSTRFLRSYGFGFQGFGLRFECLGFGV